MTVIFNASGDAVNTGGRSAGVRMWAVEWRTYHKRKVETWGFVGSLSDVCDLSSALRRLDLLSVKSGTARGLGRRRLRRAAALTKARLRRDPLRRVALLMDLADAGYLGPLT